MKKTIKSLGDTIYIKEQELKGRNLGYFNPNTFEIVINKNQSKAGKYAILIHEFIHFCEMQLIAQKIIKRRADHNFVTNLAPNLLLLLVYAGVIRDIDKKELGEFFKTIDK